jgi:transposase
MSIATVGIDLAKNVFGIHGVDDKGRVAVRKVLTRRRPERLRSKPDADPQGR